MYVRILTHTHTKAAGCQGQRGGRRQGCQGEGGRQGCQGTSHTHIRHIVRILTHTQNQKQVEAAAAKASHTHTHIQHIVRILTHTHTQKQPDAKAKEQADAEEAAAIKKKADAEAEAKAHTSQ